MLNIILVNSYFVLVGDRNQSHTKPSDSGLYILFHAVGEVNFCHNDASNEEFLLLIFVLKSICGE